MGCAQRFPVRIDAGEVYLSFDETMCGEVGEVGEMDEAGAEATAAAAV